MFRIAFTICFVALASHSFATLEGEKAIEASRAKDIGDKEKRTILQQKIDESKAAFQQLAERVQSTFAEQIIRATPLTPDRMPARRSTAADANFFEQQRQFLANSIAGVQRVLAFENRVLKADQEYKANADVYFGVTGDTTPEEIPLTVKTDDLGVKSPELKLPHGTAGASAIKDVTQDLLDQSFRGVNSLTGQVTKELEEKARTGHSAGTSATSDSGSSVPTSTRFEPKPLDAVTVADSVKTAAEEALSIQQAALEILNKKEEEFKEAQRKIDEAVQQKIKEIEEQPEIPFIPNLPLGANNGLGGPGGADDGGAGAGAPGTGGGMDMGGMLSNSGMRNLLNPGSLAATRGAGAVETGTPAAIKSVSLPSMADLKFSSAHPNKFRPGEIGDTLGKSLGASQAGSVAPRGDSVADAGQNAQQPKDQGTPSLYGQPNAGTSGDPLPENTDGQGVDSGVGRGQVNIPPGEAGNAGINGDASGKEEEVDGFGVPSLKKQLAGDLTNRGAEQAKVNPKLGIMKFVHNIVACGKTEMSLKVIHAAQERFKKLCPAQTKQPEHIPLSVRDLAGQLAGVQ